MIQETDESNPTSDDIDGKVQAELDEASERYSRAAQAIQKVDAIDPDKSA